jgi:hypothetical protein
VGAENFAQNPRDDNADNQEEEEEEQEIDVRCQEEEDETEEYGEQSPQLNIAQPADILLSNRLPEHRISEGLRRLWHDLDPAQNMVGADGCPSLKNGERISLGGGLGVLGSLLSFERFYFLLQDEMRLGQVPVDLREQDTHDEDKEKDNCAHNRAFESEQECDGKCEGQDGSDLDHSPFLNGLFCDLTGKNAPFLRMMSHDGLPEKIELRYARVTNLLYTFVIYFIRILDVKKKIHFLAGLTPFSIYDPGWRPGKT